MLDYIDKISEQGECAIIHFLPCAIPDNDEADLIFYSVRDYFEKTYLKEFAKKVVRIMLRLMPYYTLSGFVVGEYLGFNKKIKKYQSIYPAEQNIKNILSEKEMAEIISASILSKGISSVWLVFGNPSDMAIYIGTDFVVDIHNATSEQLDFLKLLVHAEGLFLWQR